MTCLFCGRAGKMSKEHLWPGWARRTFSDEDQKKVIPHSIELNDGRSPRKWSAPIFSAVLRGVCEQCNNGWMAQYEAIAKEFAEPLIKGESSFLDQSSQMLLSAWTYMKVLLLERTDSRQRMLPKARYQRVFAAAQQGGMTIPPSVTVFVATHVGDLAGQYQHRGLLPRGSKASRPDLFVGTFTLRHLVVQVIDNLEEDCPVIPERELLAEGRDRRIWPPTKPDFRIWPPAKGIRWPLARPLNDEELCVFAGPTSEG